MKDRDAPIGAGRRTNRPPRPAPLSRPGRKPPEHLSHSSIGDYATCPALYALARLDRAPRSVTRSSSVGSVAHRVVDLMSGGDDASEAIVEAIEAQSDEDARSTPSVGEVTDLLDHFSLWAPTDPNRASLVATEKLIKGRIGGFDFRCLVDAIDRAENGALIFSDYKTGKTPSPVDTDPITGEPIFTASVTRQVVTYAVVARSTGMDVRFARILYPKTRTCVEIDLDSERGEILMTEATRYVTYQADRMMRSFDTGMFQPRPSPGRCGTCPVSDSCPASLVGARTEADAA